MARAVLKKYYVLPQNINLQINISKQNFFPLNKENVSLFNKELDSKVICKHICLKGKDYIVFEYNLYGNHWKICFESFTYNNPIIIY